MDCVAGTSWSWVIKNIMKQRELVMQHQTAWNNLLSRPRFKMSNMYAALIKDNLNVDWRGVLKWNNVRPRALITLWLLCHGKMATKDRMRRFRLITESICNMCKEVDESINHVFFECRDTNRIWKATLEWMNIDREPKGWNAEFKWIDENTKKKG
ncbi:uncharacterized protein LOC131613801 [Vicia villosa]|uniref:uncharacterized protein LOC131613801 n=1 Tax=Vicia villosa TaxID=3911 RepID=UPI00273B7B0B|nr:uncharacterized protein LOC131613801 [Vicia villosa]